MDWRISLKIMITGATGMIGSALVAYMQDQHTLTLVGRSYDKIRAHFSDRHAIVTWDKLKTQGETFIHSQDVIINLAGENIGDNRWSASQKEKIINSRTDATGCIAKMCASLGKNAPRILNASAVGIYGFSSHEIFTEKSVLKTPDGFLSTVGTLWEQALLPAEKANVPIVKMRFGVVLSKKGGALKKMLPAFQLGLGAVLGSGKQLFSWIALSDLIRAIDFLISHPEITGPVNLVSPHVVSQTDFAKALAHALHRPCFMRLPAWFIHFLFGQMGDELLLQGQSVKSEKLLQAGFQFQLDTIHKAFDAILSV